MHSVFLNSLFMSLVYRPSLLFIVASLFPLVFIILCNFIYYNGNHNASSHFPTLSEIAVQPPESRVFTVGFTVSAWLYLPVFIIIYNLVSIKKSNLQKSPIWLKICIFSSMVFALLSIASLIGAASISIKESKTFHNFCGSLFIISVSLYFLLVDMQFIYLKLIVTPISWMCTFTIPTAVFISSFFISPYKSYFQYLGITFISFKLLAISASLPRMGLLMTKKPQ